MLRYLIPIVQLHSWRGVPMQTTQTIILRPPANGAAGPAVAVQIRADGTTAVGTWDGQTFAPARRGDGVIIGNVSVMSIPPTVGVAADLTVQAPVEVAADGMFPNGSTARGFAAGTSVVPVGYLSGETDPTTTVTLIDAKATLAAPATTPLSSSRSTPPAPQRPRAPG